MASAPDADTAVRNYLQYLEDPSKLVDPAEVARLRAATQSATDPLDRLRAVEALRQLEEGDAAGYREAFCAHAKAWAEANGIRPSSFRELGVDEATLRAAGFSVRGGARPRTTRRPARSGRTQVRVEHVKDAAGRQTGTFTLADLAAASGASPMTIRKAVEEMIADGAVERLGPTPDWSQPGRAPIQYRSAASRPRRSRADPGA
jgi:hypothetical protein